MSKDIDKILFENLKRGSEKAFTQIFDKYWKQLFLSAQNILKDEELCKDIVQEIFIALWNRHAELSINNLNAYLVKATKYKVARVLYENKKYSHYCDLYESYAAVDTTENLINFEELSSIIENGVQRLPNKCGEVFQLSRMEGMSNEDIAQKLHISRSTVENHINKALKLLKQQLGEYQNLLSIISVFL